MRTEAQIQASRDNGAKSLGPLTDAGKAASSMNSLRTGIFAEAEIIKGENPADLEALTVEFYEEFDPQTPSDRVMVDSVIRNTWSLRRLARADAQLWNENMKRTEVRSGNPYPLGDACNYNESKAQERVQRRINGISRLLDRALMVLRADKKRRKEEARAEEKAFRIQANTIDTYEAEAKVRAENDAALLNATNDSNLGFAPSNPDEADCPLFIPIKPPTSAPLPLPNREKRDQIL